MFNILSPSIVFQEVPGEISLALTVTGCRLGCKGCHSPELWHPQNGQPLTRNWLATLLKQYQGMITCVVFFGGEWQPQTLCTFLSLCRNAHLKTCLYTGCEDVSEPIKALLTYLKTGPWQAARGGLDNPKTNQRFIDIEQQKILNPLFIKD